eukprot:3995200-Pyramimonas_sp.AAC.1
MGVRSEAETPAAAPLQAPEAALQSCRSVDKQARGGDREGGGRTTSSSTGYSLSFYLSSSFSCQPFKLVDVSLPPLRASMRSHGGCGEGRGRPPGEEEGPIGERAVVVTVVAAIVGVAPT